MLGEPGQVCIEHAELFDEARHDEDHQGDDHADGERCKKRRVDQRRLDLLAKAPCVLKVNRQALHDLALAA